MDASERVVSQTAVRIGNVEIVMWDGEVLVQCQRQVAMGIDQTQSASAAGVLKRQIQQKRRFTGAGLPNDIQVMHPVGLVNAKGPVAVLVPCNAKRGDVGSHPPIVIGKCDLTKSAKVR